jgi:hypothetical protein
MKLYMFRTVPQSIIRSSSLYTQQWYMSYTFSDSLRAGSACSQAVCITVWHTPLLCVQWKTLDDGLRNCPKHVEFHSKNKFEKLVHLVGFIIGINRNSFEVQFVSCSKHSLSRLWKPVSWCNSLRSLYWAIVCFQARRSPESANWCCDSIFYFI